MIQGTKGLLPACGHAHVGEGLLSRPVNKTDNAKKQGIIRWTVDFEVAKYA